MVVITRDRRDNVLNTIGYLTRLPEQAPVIVVDNASSDGTVESVRAAFPQVRVIRLTSNHGSPARSIGVRAATTPYVAFADDDSCCASGALSRAARVFDAHPRLGLLAGRILVGPEESLDPVCGQMPAARCRPRTTRPARGSWGSSPAAPSSAGRLTFRSAGSPR